MQEPALLTATSDRLYFQGSGNGVDFYPIYTDAGARYMALGLSATLALWHTLDRHELIPYRWIKIEIRTAQGALIAQAANRLFKTLRLHAEGM